jgi:hypothetical protein
MNEIGNRVLHVTMDDDDSGATTIRGYLCALAAAVWREGEGFSGKRPFGNSGWQWDVYAALVKTDLIAGTFDEYGGLENADTTKGDQLIEAAIRALAQQPGEAS